ncbi:hypothetical protein [Marinicella sp. W31]|uniref:hypothetical protein n=1 Tax=Marinicella sp. W31 TaxID=3023713 RepID=UPI003757395D
MKAVLMCSFVFYALNCFARGPQQWGAVNIFPEAPLEVKLGAFDEQTNPDALAMVLWNDGNNNRLDAVRIPAPYDNSVSVTSTPLENTATLFALGDVCTVGNNVIVPYIKNFNVEIARFNGSSWSQMTLPGTINNNFDNADCGVTSDGVFILTHDLTDGESEIFRSTNSGSSYTFYGRYASSGPFDGAVREPLATNFGQRYFMTVSQLPTGQLRATHVDTADNVPVFQHTTIGQFPAPSGFTFVKESSAKNNGTGISMIYNVDGNARALDIPANNPANFIHRNLGPVSQSGSQYTFQGLGLLTILDSLGFSMENLFADDDLSSGAPYSTASVTSVNNYPLAGIGGPVDACVAKQESIADGAELFVSALFVGARVGPDGTTLYNREVAGDPIFRDGFESGDSSAWLLSCP